MISQKYRFHGRSSLKYVFTNGNNIRNSFFSVKWTANSHRKHPRVAVIVSKKVYKSAVRRNRIRRRVYTAVQPILGNAPPIDIAINIYSPEVLMLTNEELIDQLLPSLNKAGLTK